MESVYYGKTNFEKNIESVEPPIEHIFNKLDINVEHDKICLYKSNIDPNSLEFSKKDWNFNQLITYKYDSKHLLECWDTVKFNKFPCQDCEICRLNKYKHNVIEYKNSEEDKDIEMESSNNISSMQTENSFSQTSNSDIDSDYESQYQQSMLYNNF